MFDVILMRRVHDAQQLAKPVNDKVARQVADALRLGLLRNPGTRVPSALTSFVNDGSYELSDFVHMLHEVSADRCGSDLDAIDSLRIYAEFNATSTAGRGQVTNWPQD